MGYVHSVCFAGPKCHLVVCGRCAPIPAEIQTRNTAKADTQAICSERHVDQHDGQQSQSLQNRFCSLKKRNGFVLALIKGFAAPVLGCGRCLPRAGGGQK
jgi:hypothetical protein